MCLAGILFPTEDESASSVESEPRLCELTPSQLFFCVLSRVGSKMGHEPDFVVLFESHISSSGFPQNSSRRELQMILHWEQLPLHYGPEVATHRGRFETAGQTTYGILCCRFGPDDVRLASQDGEHAEARLLQH